MSMKNLVLCILGLHLTLSTVGADDEVLHISAFNIRIFGITKAGKPAVMDTLVEIIRKYDIILIQEIRDISGTAIVQLLDQVNDKGTPLYEMEISDRLGRTSSKEQYAFLYRTNVGIRAVQSYQYPDTQDVFQREPYAVKFSVGDNSVNEIVLVGIHTDPDDAVVEIDALDDVHTKVQQEMGTENILILGDLNADCTYVGQKASRNLILREDPKYHWLIEDDVDTTVSATDCAYDRFILTGSDFLKSVVPDSAGVFRFDLEYSLSQTETEAVSDHYPIEMKIRLSKSSLSPPKGDTNTPSRGASITNIVDAVLKALDELWLW